MYEFVLGVAGWVVLVGWCVCSMCCAHYLCCREKGGVFRVVCVVDRKYGGVEHVRLHGRAVCFRRLRALLGDGGSLRLKPFGDGLFRVQLDGRRIQNLLEEQERRFE